MIFRLKTCGEKFVKIITFERIIFDFSYGYEKKTKKKLVFLNRYIRLLSERGLQHAQNTPTQESLPILLPLNERTLVHRLRKRLKHKKLTT